MQRDPYLYLVDMEKAHNYLVERRQSRTYDDFTTDLDLNWGVERAFILISEALTLLGRYHPDVADRISERPAIFGLRNLVVHQYWKISPMILWETMATDIPRLKVQVDALIVESGIDAL